MSLRLRLANAWMRALVKPGLRHAPAPVNMRHILDRAARRVFRAPPYSLFLTRDLAPGLKAMLIENRPFSRPPDRRRAILYLHGGGFIAGSPTTHRAMLARLARLTGLPVWAPEHPFPAALEDVRAAWGALDARGYAPCDIVLAGDSAGGNLALALLSELTQTGQAPGACLCFSPVVDLSFSGASMTENAAADAVLPADRKGDIAAWYLDGQAADDPRASPLLAKFETPPPVFLQYGETEILRDDSRHMAEVLRTAGGVVVEDVWPDTPHVFVMLDGYVPEARAGLRRAAAFLAQHLDGSP